MFDLFSRIMTQMHHSAFLIYQAASAHITVNIALILLLGISAQWLAWVLHLPSILLLMVFGFLAGPVIGLVNPDQLLGQLLTPIVSLSVAVILFEGGLNLKVADLRKIGRAVRGLISIGVLTTWTLATLFAHWLLPLRFDLCLLLGAVLTVTGPTVILPLVRQIKPDYRIAAILKWEGIVVDPVGATLSVLVFQVVLIGTFQNVPQTIVSEFLLVMFWGTLVGTIGAALLYLMFRFHLAPEFLDNPLTLALVIGTYALSNQIQAESGLLAVTIAGILLGNQRAIPVRHILQFKENLQVLLISVLFILLSARMRFSDLAVIDSRLLLFLGLLIFVIRPIAVLLSTIGSDLSRREKIFVAFLAPRGIVAASVASVFSLRLTEAGNLNAYLLAPYMFVVIMATVCFYGLTAGPIARYLQVSQRNPQGTLIIGAHDWARDMALRLRELGIPLLLLDRNTFNILEAHRAGLPVLEKSCLAEDVSDEVELSTFRRLLCLTSNDNVNSLAQMRFQEFFHRQDLYQLPLEMTTEMPREFCGRFLFSPQATYLEISQRFARGQRFRLFSGREWQELCARMIQANESHSPPPIAFFRFDTQDRLDVLIAAETVKIEATDRVIALCDTATQTVS